MSAIGSWHPVYDRSLAWVGMSLETEEQLAFLRSFGCEEIQGYYYSRPLPEDDSVKFLQSAKT